MTLKVSTWVIKKQDRHTRKVQGMVCFITQVAILMSWGDCKSNHNKMDGVKKVSQVYKEGESQLAYVIGFVT